MTPALLFALVDAVLESAREETLFFCDPYTDECDTCARYTSQLGWWRSLWPLGGGE